MAFAKTGRAITPVKVYLPPSVGDIRGNQVWDGSKWVPVAEWETAQSKSS